MLGDEIKKGESDTMEFKRTLPTEWNKALKTIVAFANGEGGKIVFGIDDKTHEIVGVDHDERSRLQDSLTDMISNNCTPQIFPIYTWMEMSGKALFIVEIPISHHCPYYIKAKGLDHGVYVRVDATTRLAEPEKVRELQLYGSHRTHDEIVEHGTPPATKDEIKSLCEDIQEYRGDAEKPVTVRQLVAWRLLETRQGEYLPTIAFRLLTRADIPFSGIQCARFDGVKRVNFIDRKFFEGPVHHQLENTQRFVRQYLKVGADISNIIRKDVYEIPLIAMREALANAIIHRNYLIRGYIQVSIFDDRVEISSPGSLYAHLTLEQMMAGGSRLRNPVLAGAFMRMGIVEQWGTGIQRIHDICRAVNAPLPEYRILGDSVTVIFYRSAHPATPAANFSSDEELVLALLRTTPHTTRTQMAQTLHIKEERIDYIIRKLRKSGILIRKGSNKNGAWTVND